MVVDSVLARSNYPYELLVCDNGSTDERVIDYIRSLKPAVHILNRENRGIAPMHNILLKLAKGDYFCLIGNDIELPHNWLSDLVTTYEKIPDAGMAGIHCVSDLPAVEPIGDQLVRPSWNVFGTMFWSREVFNKVGYFFEGYTPYGLDDSDYHYRLNKMGYQNFYLGAQRSIHIGEDMGQNSEYRQMKNESLAQNLKKFNWATQYYDQNRNYYLPFDNDFIINQNQFFNPDL
jgi:GT2 family glycosyltransferase